MDSSGALSGVGLALAIIGGAFVALLVVGLLTLVLATVMRRLLGVPVGWPRTVIVAGVVVVSTVGIFGATLWDLTATAPDNDYFTGVNLPSSVLVLLIATLWMLGFGSAILMVMELIVPTGALPGPLRMATSFRTRRERNRRYRQVIGVFVRNGLAAPFSRPRGSPTTEVAVRFRRALEEAGTTFVKLGQNLSTRTDVLPVAFTDELSTLQSRARASSWDVIEKEIDAELADRTAEVFSWLDPEPLAAASVAQVHRGRLTDGTEVVVKVQRPGTREEVAKDSDILLEICAWLERTTAWGKDIGLTDLARGFTDTLSEELDYTIEARNMEDLRAVLRGGPITVPKAYPDYSTSRMLIMDYVPGPTIGTAAAELDDLDPQLRTTLGQELLSSVMSQIMEHGVFHADVHPGNVTLIDDGEDGVHLGLLDFGAVGRIDRHTRHNLSVVFAAIDNGDSRLLVDALKALLGRPDSLEEAELDKAVGTLLARYGSGLSRSVAGMVADVMAMVTEFRFSSPASVSSALRSLASMEGTLTLIDPQANIIEMARTHGATLARTWLKPDHLKETLEATVLETLPMFRHLPRRVNAVVEDLHEGRLTFNMRFFSDRNDRQFITGMLQQFTVAILAGFTLLGGVVLLAFGTGGPPVTEEMSLLQAVGFIMLFAGFMMALRIVTMVLYRDDKKLTPAQPGPNAQSGTAKLGPMSDIDALRCSDAQVEPLPGSAKQESVYVLYEHPFGWSRDILDGDTFGEELTAQLTSFLKKRAGLQLIRFPGRDGRTIERPRLFLVFTEAGVAETMLVDGPEDILNLDLSGPGRNGAQQVDHPLVLVCTHGKRDVCCAVKGRPVAKALVETYLNESNELMVWETSHTKGHRFAPSLMLMPWGYSFGRLNEEAASAMVNYAMAGRYFLPGNRGRGLFSPRGQVAELAVAAQLVEAGERLEYGQLRADDERVTHLDGRSWTVTMDKREVDDVVSSCGDKPKTGSVWEAVEVTAME